MRKKEERQAVPDYHPPWKLKTVISGHLGWVRAVAVEPGNQWFATGAGDRVVKVRRRGAGPARQWMLIPVGLVRSGTLRRAN